MKTEKQNPVVVKLPKGTSAKSSDELNAYVVNSGGKIVESAPFRDDEATLNISKTSIDAQSKVYIAQPLPHGLKSSANERTLQKMSAYEIVKNFNGNIIDVNRLPGIIIDPFPFHNCLVTGHVFKNFNIDGQNQKLPLCDMRVHVCEVETEFLWPHLPIYYRTIPDWVLQEVAQKIIDLNPQPLPPIVVNPLPGPSGPPDPIGPVSFAKINRPLSSLTSTLSASPIAKKAASPAPLPVDVLNTLKIGSVNDIRQLIVNNHDILYPYFCLWPIYWPWFYFIVNEQIVSTDCNGHFEAWELLFGPNAEINIYIWIEANINGQWVTVYRPPLPCNTHWNYQCNTDISIIVTDPRVEPCNCGTDGPADAVWFRSIGQSASAFTIEQNLTSTVAIQGVNMANVGCTNILSYPIRPFGGGLYFEIFCGANIFNAGVTHYRWKYTNIADANLNTIPVSSQVTTIIPGAVSRPYLVKLSATHYETHYVTLGAVGNAPDIAYHIPHQDITQETLIPTVDQALSPTWNDVFFDSAYIDSHSLTDGLYRFDLELLSQDSARNFHVVSVDRATFQVSEANDISSSTDAPDDYLLPPNPFLEATSLSFYTRIDNAPCVGDIHDATVIETRATSGPCGFIKYTDPSQHVQLSFEASHPRNFATFSYGVVKGNGTQATGINPNGSVISSIGGFTLAGGLYSADFTVAGLLNGCPGQAAYSENLHVAALATDGTYRLYAFDYHDTATNTDYSYDAYDVNAFALSNT